MQLELRKCLISCLTIGGWLSDRLSLSQTQRDVDSENPNCRVQMNSNSHQPPPSTVQLCSLDGLLLSSPEQSALNRQLNILFFIHKKIPWLATLALILSHSYKSHVLFSYLGSLERPRKMFWQKTWDLSWTEICIWLLMFNLFKTLFSTAEQCNGGTEQLLSQDKPSPPGIIKNYPGEKMTKIHSYVDTGRALPYCSSL